MERKQKEKEPLGALDGIPKGISHLGHIVSRAFNFFLNALVIFIQRNGKHVFIINAVFHKLLTVGSS